VKRWKRTKLSALGAVISGGFDSATLNLVSSAETAKWDAHSWSNTGTQNVFLGRENLIKKLSLDQFTRGRKSSRASENADTLIVSILNISKSLSLLVK
jgi:hypothetical protein